MKEVNCRGRLLGWVMAVVRGGKFLRKVRSAHLVQVLGPLHAFQAVLAQIFERDPFRKLTRHQFGGLL